MLERIAKLREEAEAAIAAARSSAELEELRVRHLGRKAELPNLLRGVRELPPEERGPVGQAANQARQALEEMIARRAGAHGRSATVPRPAAAPVVRTRARLPTPP